MSISPGFDGSSVIAKNSAGPATIVVGAREMSAIPKMSFFNIFF